MRRNQISNLNNQAREENIKVTPENNKIVEKGEIFKVSDLASSSKEKSSNSAQETKINKEKKIGLIYYFNLNKIFYYKNERIKWGKYQR